MRLTVEGVKELFNVSEKTIYRWIKSNGLPAYRINNQYRFNRTDLLVWASEHRVDVSPAILQSNEQTSSQSATVSDALETGGIYYRVEGYDKVSVLGSVVELLRLPDRVDRAMLLEILLAREEMGSTSIGEGLAIPHPRNPIVLNVTRPSITLCFLDKPIDFDAIDGQPVNTLFTMVSPTIHSHLHLLSRLMFCLRNPEFRKALTLQRSRQEIFDVTRQAESALTDGVEASQRD